jgi:hypothetical protein
MSDQEAKQVFVSAEEFEQDSEGELTERQYKDDNQYSDIALKGQELSGLANSGNGVSRISVPRELKRQRVVNAFHDAFELIGGVPRLALWADQHPTDFFKLYARLLPAEASKSAQQDDKPVVVHVLPRGPLDE